MKSERLNKVVSWIFRELYRLRLARGLWLQTIVEDGKRYRGYRNYGTTNSPRKNLGGIGSLFSRETVAQWPAIPYTTIDNITNPPLIRSFVETHQFVLQIVARQKKTQMKIFRIKHAIRSPVILYWYS